MRESRESLNLAIDQFPVVGWLSRHVTVYDRGGQQIYADCPMCRAKKKLSIDRGRGLFHCFKCREGGHGGDIWSGGANLLRFIKIVEQCEWRDAFRMVYELAGVPEPAWQPKEKVAPRLPNDLFRLLDLGPEERSVKLLETRGVAHLIQSASLCLDANSDYFERVIIPCSFLDEDHGFEAKATTPSQSPKTLYPAWMPTEQTVYTSKRWDPTSSRVVVTESVFDAETFFGVENAVGTYGSNLHDGQVLALFELGVSDLIWAWDGDAWESTKKAIRKTFGLFRNFVLPIPDREDPNSLGTAWCSSALRSSLVQIKTEWDLTEMEIRRMA